MNEYGDGDNMVGVSVGGDGIKKCPVCTFDNPSCNTQCEICSSNLN
jgi:hypothetical protein